MLSFNFPRWIRSVFRARPKTYTKRPYVLFRLEELEARETPADLTWTGLGATPIWSDPANWTGGGIGYAPSVNSVDNFRFDNTAPIASRVMNIDIAGLNINSITINGGDLNGDGNDDAYVFTGQAITLGSPTVGSLSNGQITVGSGVGNEIRVDMTLAGPFNSKQFFTIQSGGTDLSTGQLVPGLTVSGQISGVTGAELTKQGIGLLALTNDNSGFSGPITIDNDAGIILVTHARALGAVTASEVQSIALSGASTGRFNLQFTNPSGVTSTTADLDYTATALDVQTALNGLPNIPAGTVNVVRSMPLALTITNATWSLGVATITTSQPHGLAIGDPVIIAGMSPGSYNGNFIVTGVTSTTFTYALSRTITTAVWSAGAATITTSQPHGFIVGQSVVVSGMVPAAYNGTFVITAATGTTFTYALAADPGTATTFGIAGPGAAASFGTTTLNRPTFLITFNGAYAGLNVLQLVAQGVNSTIATANTLTQGGSFAGTTVGQNSQILLSNVTGGSIFEPVVLNSRGLSDDGAIRNFAGNNVWAGTVTFGSIIPTIYLGVNANSTFEIAGLINDLGTGENLTKTGAGELIFNPPDGNTYRGVTTINNGILTIRHPQALGRPSTAPGTGTIVNSDQINGTGSLQLDGDAFAARITSATWNAGVATITTSVPHFFAIGKAVTIAGMTPSGYNGTFTITGIVPAVPAGNPSTTFTFALATNPGAVTTFGTAAGGGFGVVNETLLLHAQGPTSRGALFNLSGNNEWTGIREVIGGIATGNVFGGEITLGSVNTSAISVGIGVNNLWNLTISTTLNDAAAVGSFPLNKLGAGRLILPTKNLGFSSSTNIQAGIISMRDSQALGPIGSGGGTSVSAGAALHLEVDEFADSVTPFNTRSLRISEPLTINGAGMDFDENGVVTTNTGALQSKSGVNTYVARTASSIITLGGGATIGVDPDPNASNSDNYFTNDYSLTVTGGMANGTGTQLTKVGRGHLILPTANSYTGTTTISAGWVTIRTERALGPYSASSLGDTVSPAITVRDGAALHILPTSNFITTATWSGGTATITTPSAHGFAVGQSVVIAGMVSTLVPAGYNGAFVITSVPSPTTFTFALAVNPGTVTTFGTATLNSSTITNAVWNLGIVTATTAIPHGFAVGQSVAIAGMGPSGGYNGTFVVLSTPTPTTFTYGVNVDPGLATTFGTAKVTFNFVRNLVLTGHGITHPYALINQKGALESLGGDIVIGGPLVVAAQNIRTSNIQLIGDVGIGVEQLPSSTSGSMVITAQMQDNAALPGGFVGGFTKFGSRRLTIQNENSFSGAVTIAEGVLRAQHDKSFGLPGGGVNIQNGGASEIQRLIVTGSSVNDTFRLTYWNGVTTAPIFFGASAQTLQDILNTTPGFFPAGGSVTVTQANNNTYFITFGGTLANGVNPNELQVVTTTITNAAWNAGVVTVTVPVATTTAPISNASWNAGAATITTATSPITNVVWSAGATTITTATQAITNAAWNAGVVTITATNASATISNTVWSAGAVTVTVATPTRSIVNAAWSAGVVTITTSAPHGYTAGQAVVIAGMGPAGYDGTFIVTSVTGTTFTYTLAVDPGVATTFGTVTVPHTFNVGQTIVLAGNGNAGYNGTFVVTSRTSTTFNYALAADPGLPTSFGTVSLPHGFAAGQTIVIAGMGTPGYNGTFVITSATASTFTYALAANPGAATTLGTAARPHGFLPGQSIIISGMNPAGLNGTFLITNATSTTFTFAMVADPGPVTTFGTAALPHNFARGQTVTISGMTPAAFNGTFVITSTTPTTFTYALAANPGVATTLGTATQGFFVGQTVVISGMTPAAYNGTFVVTSVTGTTFTYSLLANPGAATAFGTVRGAASANVNTIIHGDGVALELMASVPMYNGGVSAGLQIWGERLSIDGDKGNSTLGEIDSPLTLMPGGDHLWRGPVSLNASATIKIPQTSRLTVFGVIDDAGNFASASGSDITFTGGGALSLFGANTYRGNTNIQQGIVTIENGQALGTTGVQEVQTVTIPSTVTSWNLTFNGQTTTPDFAANATDAEIQAALMRLTSINGSTSGSDVNRVGGTATVTHVGNVYRITFGGTLTGFQQPLLVANTVMGTGVIGVQGIQSVTVPVGVTSWRLAFKDVVTTSFNPGSTILDIQNALQALPNIGGIGGTVSVTQTGNTYFIILGGALANVKQPLLTATTIAGVGTVSVANSNGAGATVVTNGAQLQLQGGITVTGEPLLLSGDGVDAGSLPSVPLRWFQTGPASIGNGQIPGNTVPGNSTVNTAVSGRLTSVAVDPTDERVIYVTSAGGGAWKTTNNGITWTPLFDNQDLLSDIATLTEAAGIVTVTTTTPHGFRPGQEVTISGASLAGYNGYFRIIDTPTATTFRYAIVTGSLAAGTGGVAAVDAKIFAGSIVVAPTNPHILYVGTGEGNNTGDSYYGAGVYKSIDSGITWRLLQNPFNPTAPTNPLLGQVVNRIIVDPADADRIYVATSDRGTFGSLLAPSTASPVGSLPNAGITKAQSNGAFQATITTGAPHGFLAGQVITVSGMVPVAYNGTVTILSTTATTFTYNVAVSNPGVATTLGVLTNPVVNATWAAGVATITTGVNHTFQLGELIRLAGVNVAGFNGTFTITAVTPTSFQYALAANPGGTGNTGSLSNPIVAATWAGGFAQITTGQPHGLTIGQQVVISGVGSPNAPGYNGNFIVTGATATTFTYALAVDPGLGSTFGSFQALVSAPGVWRYDFTENWYNLTGVVSTTRSSVPSALPGGTISIPPAAIPNTPGPDDDYTAAFPQYNASWADISLSLPTEITITGASWNNGFATINTASVHGFRNGQQINISGMRGNGYNGSWVVLSGGSSTTSQSFTFALANNPGAVTQLGTTRIIGSRVLYATLGTSAGSGSNSVYRLKEPDVITPILPFYWLSGDQINGQDSRNQGWSNPVNEVQTITFSPNITPTQTNVTGYTLTYRTNANPPVVTTSGVIAYTGNQLTDRNAIQAFLAPLIPGVQVTSTTANVFTIVMDQTNQLQLTSNIITSQNAAAFINHQTLTDGGPFNAASPASTPFPRAGGNGVIKVGVGGNVVNEVQRLTWTNPVTSYRLTYNNNETEDLFGFNPTAIAAALNKTDILGPWILNSAGVPGVIVEFTPGVANSIDIHFVNNSVGGSNVLQLGLSSVVVGTGGSVSTGTAIGGTGPRVYAAVSNTGGNLVSIQRANDGGRDWVVGTGDLPNYLNTQGNTDNVVLVSPTNPDLVYVGGAFNGVDDPRDFIRSIFVTSNGGTNWSDITAGAGALPTNGVHTGQHGMTLDRTGRLLVSNDGGVWRLQNATVGAIQWNDLNGNLAVTQVNGVAQHPSDLNQMLVGANDNGQSRFTGTQMFERSEIGGEGDGGAVVYDPKNPNIAYHVRNIRLISNIQSATVAGTTVTITTPSPHGLVTGESVTIAGVTDPLYNGSFTITVLTPTTFTYIDVTPAGGPSSGGTVTANFNTSLMKSTNGGQTWTSILDGTSIYFPFVVDVNNPSRIVAGLNGGVFESLNGGTRTASGNTTFASLFAPFQPTAIALATYQGAFNNTGFPLVTDKGASAIDSDTIYITNGTNVSLTKNHGINWITRTPPNVPAGSIFDIKVDPSNRDTVYVTLSYFTGLDSESRHVLKSTDAGLTWTNISDGLPDVPTWELAIDPRTNDLYVGNDVGVYKLSGPIAAINATWNAGAVTITSASPHGLTVGQRITVSGMVPAGYNGSFLVTAATATTFSYALAVDPGLATTFGSVSTPWARLGIGMPDVQVKDVVLSEDLNILSAGTYGRSMYQFYLNDVRADSGALRAVSGDNNWAGVIRLAGDTVITVNGSQALQSGLAAAQLNVIGVISDADYHGKYKLTKDGLGDAIFSSANTYGGLTEIKAGVLVVQNAQALGDFRPTDIGITAQGGTIVNPGTALVMRSDLTFEGVELNGDGASQSNTHFNGALRNASGNNTFTGTLTLNTETTIGVDSGSSLTIGTSTLLPGSGTIVGGHGFGKELTGTLILNTANTYTGETTVNQGILHIQHSNALGTAAGGTTVLDGSRLEISTPVDGPNANVPVVVAAESLDISGTGINDTGALVNSFGNNSWNGTITFDYLPGFFPVTAPPNYVLINVGPGSSLTVNGVIDEDTSKPSSPIAFGLTKIGAGRLILNNANSYSEQTNINEGVIKITNADGLGTFGPGVPSPSPLTHNYQFNGLTPATALADSLGGPALQRTPPNGVFTGTRYDFQENAGLSLSGGLTNGGNYTVEMLFNFDDLNSWTRILDFKNRGSAAVPPQLADTGLYQITGGPGLTGALQFYDLGYGADDVFQVGVDIHITFTRNATTKQVFAYANGIQQFSFIDGNDDAVFSGPASIIHFFSDNNVGSSQGEAAPGSVEYIRIYNAPLTAAQVLQAYDNGSSTGGVVSGGAVTQTNTIVKPGAALEVGGNINVAAEDLVLNGTGINGTGALRNVDGVNSVAGNVTLQTSSSIGADADTRLTLTGVVQDLPVVPVPPATLTKVGTGTVVFTSANTYRGFTNINEGVLNIQDDRGLGFNANEVQTLTVTGTSGSYTLNFQGEITNPILPGATALEVQNELNQLFTRIPGGGSVTVTQVGNVYTVTFDGIPLAENNQIPLIANAVNGTSVTVNTLQEGNSGSGTRVANGATLQLQGGINIAVEALTLNGPGFANGGALQNVSGTNAWLASPILLESSSSIGSLGTAPADRLILNTAITEMTPSLGITKVGPGVAQYTGTTSNAYTGLTRVIEGTLELNKSIASGAVLGNLTVGNVTPINEVQTLNIPATVTTFSLTFNGNTTATPIAYTGVSATDIAAISAALNVPAILGAGGSVVVTSTAANTFTITFGGTLAGSNQPPITATVLSGAGVITTGPTINGAPFSANSDVVKLLQANQIADTSNVIINGDGFLDLDGFTEQVTNLTMNDGHAKINNAGGTGSFTVSTSVTLNGGLIDNAGLNSTLHLPGTLQTTSTANTSAIITGANGTIDLTGSLGGVAVANGPQASDFVVGNRIVGVPAITKTGPGRMEITTGGAITMLTTINDGDLQVNAGATAGNVELNAATSSISGQGNIGTITGSPSPASPAVGTVNPGANGVPANTGILNSQSVKWGPGTTFFVNLDNPDGSATPPVAGVEYDRLAITGDADLGGASLLGTVGANVQIADSFTILTTTGSITGNFFGLRGATSGLILDGDFVFVGGVKFILNYVDGADADLLPDSVVLNRVLMTAQSVITANPDTTPTPGSTSIYGELVTYTVTITPEPGASLPATSTVTYLIDGVTHTTTLPLTITGGGSSGTASLDPQTFFGILPLSPGYWAAGTTHTIDAQLNAFGFNSSPATQFTQTITKAATNVVITPTPLTSTFGQPVLLQANVTAVSPGNGPPSNGTLTFYVNSITPANLLGTGTLTGSTYSFTTAPNRLPVGTHSIIAVFTGDTNLNDRTVTRTGFVVTKATTAITSVTTGGSLIYGAPMSLTVEVSATSPGSPGAPIGTVTVLDTTTGTTLGTGTVTASGPSTSQITFNFNAPSAVTHNLTINFVATPPATTNFSNSTTTSSFVIAKANTTTTLTSSAPIGAVAQTITYTATVATVAPSVGAVNSGTVTFVNTTTGQTIGTANVNATGIATLNSTLNSPLYNAGVNSIVATYNPPTVNPNFNTSVSNTLSQSMLRATTVGYTANPNPSIFGQTVNINVTVAGTGVAPPLATGSVSIFEGATLLTSGPLVAGSVALSLANLSLGNHTLSIVYSGDAIYAPNTITRTQSVQQAGTTTSVTSNSPVQFGQSSSFTAVVTAAFGGTPTLAVVTFFDGATPIGSGSFVSSNATSMTYSFTPLVPLSVGTHAITARYAGSVEFATSTSANHSHVVAASTTTTTLTSNSPTQFGQFANFTAHVDSAGGVTPSGNVTFFDGVTPIGTVPLTLTGDAVLSITTLSTASHTIRAVYNSTTNFTTSTSNVITHVVNQASTSTTVTSDAVAGSVFGQIVTFSITVTATSGGFPGTPTGTVNLFDGITQIASNRPLVNGVATFQTSALAFGTRSITAQYSGASDYAISTSGVFSQTVNTAATTTALSSTPMFWALNEQVIFAATVAANTPSTAVPTGSVIFTIDGVDQAPVAVTGGQATLPHTFTLTSNPNNHTVSVRYVSDNLNNFSNSSAAAQTQNVRRRTDIVLGTSLPDGALENEPVTFYALVTGAGGVPTGVVNFFDNGVLIGTGTLNASGIATLTLANGLTIGNHNITAMYVGDATFNPAVPATALNQVVVRNRINGRLIY